MTPLTALRPPLPTQHSPFTTLSPHTGNPTGHLLRYDPADGVMAPHIHTFPYIFPTLSLHAGNPTGRLLRYDPASGTTTVLATKLWYANGVALAADESFVAVAETNVFRVMRYWLKGPKVNRMQREGGVGSGRGGEREVQARLRRQHDGESCVWTC